MLLIALTEDVMKPSRTNAMKQLAIAVAIGLVPGAAQGATASATLRNVQITIVDLDLNDGIAAGFTADPTLRQTLFYGFTQETFEPWETATRTFENAGLTIVVSAGEGFVSAAVEGPRGDVAGSSSRSFGGTAFPNTRLVFTADADVSASVDAGCTPLCENAYALADVFLLGGRSPAFSLLASVRGHSNLTDADSAPVSLSIDNTQTYGVEIGFEWRTTAVNTLLPVPEPQTYALMLAGLALCASAVRRRRGSSD